MSTVVVATNFGIAVPEGRVREVVAKLVEELRQGHTIAPIAQHEIILGLRVAVKQGLLTDLTFEWGSDKVRILPDGQPDHWPPGFPGTVVDDYLMQLLD